MAVFLIGFVAIIADSRDPKFLRFPSELAQNFVTCLIPAIMLMMPAAGRQRFIGSDDYRNCLVFSYSYLALVLLYAVVALLGHPSSHGSQRAEAVHSVLRVLLPLVAAYIGFVFGQEREAPPDTPEAGRAAAPPVARE